MVYIPHSEFGEPASEPLWFMPCFVFVSQSLIMLVLGQVFLVFFPPNQHLFLQEGETNVRRHLLDFSLLQ